MNQHQQNVVEEFPCRSGVVLEVFKPSGMAIDRAIEQLSKDDPPPEIPKVWMEDKGREEPNPNDPAYRLALTRWNSNVSKRTFRTMVVTGVRAKSLPDGFPAPDSKEVRNTIEAMGLKWPENEVEQHLLWVELFALKDGDDLRVLSDKLYTLAGLSPEDVAEAIESFLGDAERATDLATSNQRSSGHGDQDGERQESAVP